MKKTYRERLWREFSTLLVSWPNTVPGVWKSVRNAARDTIDNACLLFCMLLALILCLLLPFTAIFAPLWLWVGERLEAHARKQQEDFARYYGDSDE